MAAERHAAGDPTAAAFFAGKTVEVAVKWAFRTDPGLKLPYQDNIAALLHEPSFRRIAGEAVFAKARYINTLRNRAVHEEKRIARRRQRGRQGAVPRLLLARPHLRAQGKPADTPDLRRRAADAPRRRAEARLRRSSSAAGRARRQERRADRAARRPAGLDEELERLRAEVAAARQAAEARPDRTTTTRPRPATASSTCCCARPAGRSTGRTTPSSASRACRTTKASASSTTCCGAPTASRSGSSRPSAPRRPRTGQQQAKLYADCLEARYGGARSSSVPTATSTGSGTTRAIRRDASAASTSATSWSC